jgi:hypothetical protein
MHRAWFVESASHLAVSVAVVLGCSSQPALSARDAADASDTGGKLAARSPSERALLDSLPSLPPGVARRVGAVTVTAEAPYAAASGRTCRVLRLDADRKGQGSRRLACSDGTSWFFVPDVFSAESGPE